MTNPFVPDDFDVPSGYRSSDYQLEMLEPSIVDLDYDAVMSSRENLRRVFAENDKWPADDMTLKENLNDLVIHKQEFLDRKAFAYTVLNLERNKCLGCLYIEPSNRDEYDAEIYYWLRDDTLHLEDEFSNAMREWIAERWPFKNVIYPGRDIPWNEFGKRSHNHI